MAATVREPNCRCGHPHRQHVNYNGVLRGCDGHNMSGGQHGSIQRCSCFLYIRPEKESR